MTPNEVADAILIVIRRLAKWLLVVTLGLVALALLSWGALVAYSDWERRPRVAEALGGISLSDKPNDVFFRLGAFDTRPIDPDNPGETVYEQKLKDDASLQFVVEGGAIKYIAKYCSDKVDYTSVNNIACRTKGEAIMEKYSGRIRVLCLAKLDTAQDKFVRVYDAVEFGIRHMMYQNEVQGFFILRPAYLQGLQGKAWRPCT